MNNTFYRLWLPVSLVVHAAMLLTFNAINFAVTPLPGSNLIPINIIEESAPADEPEPLTATPAVTPMVTPTTPQPPEIQLPARAVADPGKPIGDRHAQSGVTHGTSTHPGAGLVTDPTAGTGTHPTAPPAIMRVENGTNPPAPAGVDGGTGTQGTDIGPSGPSYAARAKYGRREGSDKLAGEINENGVALFTVEVDAAGGVTNIRKAKGTGSDELDQIALKLVRRYDFEPAMSKGTPTGGVVQMRVTFTRGQYVVEEVK